MARKIIETVLSEGHQDQTLRQIYKVGNFKFKIEIKSDSFKRQCYARGYVLDGLNWNLIYSIPYSEMETPSELIYTNKYKNQVPFHKDLKRIEEKLEEIIL